MAESNGALIVINLLKYVPSFGGPATDIAINNAAKAVIAARRFRVLVVHAIVPIATGEAAPEPNAPLTSRPPLDPRLGPTRLEGTEFDPRVVPTALESVVRGRTAPSAFQAAGLAAYLGERDVKRLWIAGFPTETCVESTARDALDHGYEVEVLTDCCAGLTREGHDTSMANLLGLAERGSSLMLLPMEDFYQGRRVSLETARSVVADRSSPTSNEGDRVTRPSSPPPSRPSR